MLALIQGQHALAGRLFGSRWFQGYFNFLAPS
jgi:hypothetical protein